MNRFKLALSHVRSLDTIIRNIEWKKARYPNSFNSSVEMARKALVELEDRLRSMEGEFGTDSS